MEVVVDTNLGEERSQPTTPDPPAAVASTTEVLYKSTSEALRGVHKDYLYWTGKLTETSLQLSYAVIAANWAVFGSVDRILTSFWSKLSVALVVLGLGLSVAGAKWMGELHRQRIDYAETDPSRWNAEFRQTSAKRDPWPFTNAIESLGRTMRELKTWLPLAAGLSFLIALLSR